MPYYPAGLRITAFDITPGMLARARRQEISKPVQLHLLLADAQRLPFPANAFDEAVATFVFCSVPDPVLGLQELSRVVRPGGRLFLLEHMRAENPLLGVIMDVLNPLFRLMGPDINRHTLENIQKSDWHIEKVKELDGAGIFKLIVATKDDDA